MNNQNFRAPGFNIMPLVVKNLLIVNGLMFLATIAFESVFHINLSDYLGLHYFTASKFSPFQFITYMFMHGSVSHIFFNMFSIWMFGSALENVWGPKRFLIFYLITGIGAALVHYFVMYLEFRPFLAMINQVIADPSLDNMSAIAAEHTFMINSASGHIYDEFVQFQKSYRMISSGMGTPANFEDAKMFFVDYKNYYLNLPVVIGASGAGFGILMAFGMIFPNAMMLFPIPMKVKWFVLLYGAIELYSGFYESDSNVAHFAHLGGMIFAYLLIKYWKRKGVY